MTVTATRGRIRRRTYTVRGSTLAEIDAAIERSGPRDPNDGRRYSGVCEGTLELVVDGRDWEFEREGEDTPIRMTCRLGGGSVELTCEIQTPELRTPLESRAAQREWERFVAAVVVHEDGHIDEYMVEATAVAREVSALSASGEGRTERAAQADAHAAFMRLLEPIASRRSLEQRANEAAARYDRANRHGRSQGAVLDRTIT